MWSETVSALLVRDQGSHQLGLAVGGLFHSGAGLACPSGGVVDEFRGAQVVVLDLSGE